MNKEIIAFLHNLTILVLALGGLIWLTLWVIGEILDRAKPVFRKHKELK